MDSSNLKIQYSNIADKAERLRQTMVEQVNKLLDNGKVTLGVPMESRVKTWLSIEEKLERKKLRINNIKSIPDLIGIRTILLFRADLDLIDRLIIDTFDILSSEDAANLLGEAQFGYQSKHYSLQLPKTWLKIPSMADLGDLQVELQVRTLAQHIWAAASHKLQYKHESSVPPPLRRTIYRVSALLETVDLEFDRVLAERKDYKDIGIAETIGSEPLNVDLLASILAEIFPSVNREDGEDYEELLGNLKELSVNTVDDLKLILNKHRDAVIMDDSEQVDLNLENEDCDRTTKKRLRSGVFYTHVGLCRVALGHEFDEKRVSEVINNSKKNARKRKF